MIRRIIRYVVIAMLLALVLLWILGGGIGKIIGTARSIHFHSFADLLSSSSSLSTFQLPWQFDAPQIPEGAVGANGDSNPTATVPSHAAFGSASSVAGLITIVPSAASTQTPQGQFIELIAGPANGKSLDISGWSLESALSGTRAYIPQAAPLFVQNRINTVSDLNLPAGGHAIIVTGPSPIGVSFRENMCTGYLGTLQPFTPALPQHCPLPLETIPHTSDNEARLGASCFAYLATLAPCTFPTNIPSSVSGACRIEIQNKLSYNGCVAARKNDVGFQKNVWRVYLAQGAPLWALQHDVIRLLDREGRVVGTVSY